MPVSMDTAVAMRHLATHASMYVPVSAQSLNVVRYVVCVFISVSVCLHQCVRLRSGM